MYDGSGLVNYGVEIGKPFVFVAVNYRVAGFGFMPGKELQDEGSGNEDEGFADLDAIVDEA